MEKIREKYRLRVLYMNDAEEPPPLRTDSKVWAIHKLSAIEEDGEWVLQNLLPDLREYWGHRRVGMIDYRYPSNFQFDRKRAKEANAFCEELIERFDLQYDGKIQYYLANSLEKIGLISNLEYGLSLSPGMGGSGEIKTSTGDEYYPHEFVHALLPDNSKRGHLIEEGLASFLGSKERPEKYEEEKMAPMAEDLAEGVDKIGFQKVVSQETKWNGYRTAYPAGAAICEVIHEQKGDRGIRKLMEADTIDHEATMDSITRITDLDEEAFEEEWLAVFEEYR